MQDIIDPAIVSKIDCFLQRKDRQYPELHLYKKRWNGYEYIPQRKWFNKNNNKHIHKEEAWAF